MKTLLAITALIALSACTGPTTLCQDSFECDRPAGDAPSPAAPSPPGAGAPSDAAPGDPSDCE